MSRWTEEEFASAVRSSNSIKEICDKFGLVITGGNYNTVRKYIKLYGLSISHMIKQHSNFVSKKTQDFLIFGSKCKSYRLKKRLIEEGYLLEICSACGLGPVWNHLPIKLQLDHINGKSSDNRLENLRILCPNCHSQTETFCGKNCKVIHKCACGNAIKKGAKRCKTCVSKEAHSSFCLSCGKETSGIEHKLCRGCFLTSEGRGRKTTINWPVLDELIEMIRESSAEKIGKRLGVSEGAVRQHLKKNGITSLYEIRNRA